MNTTTIMGTRGRVKEVAPGASMFLCIGGTGSMLDISRLAHWRPMITLRISFPIVVQRAENEPRLDVRTAAEHLANIREVMHPTIADLAAVFGVSRQAIYKWMNAETTPEADKFARLRALSQAADALRQADVARAPALVKMNVFDGRSLLDLAAAGQLTRTQVESLIAEARAMESAYERAALARSTATPTDDWRSEISIPGTIE